MASFDVVVDTTVLDQRLSALEREQLPFARMLAANQAAFETRATMQEAMPLYLDAPTRYTISGVRYEKATKARPSSSVYISSDTAKGTSPAQYLAPLILGERRHQKRSERVLARAGIISNDEAWVPGNALKLNRYGNITGAKMTQILSQIRAFGEEGFQANVTARSRKRGQRKKRQQYFLSRGTDIRRGVYERYGKGGRKARPILIFVKLPVYSKQFDFYRLAGDEARRRFLAAFPAALQRALRTARR